MPKPKTFPNASSAKTTKKRVIAGVREKIACIICSWTTPDVCAYPCQRDIPHSICSIALQKVDIILALPNIAVLDENRELPELFAENFSEGLRLPSINELQRYRNAMNWLIEQGWKKVLK